MKLNTALVAIAIALVPAAVQAAPIANAGIDYAAAVRQSEGLHLAIIDRVADLTDAQRSLILKLLVKEADQITGLQRAYRQKPDFGAAMTTLAQIQIGTFKEMRAILTDTQFSQMRPVFEQRRMEVVNAVNAMVNTAYYQAALDAGFNPEN